MTAAELGSPRETPAAEAQPSIAPVPLFGHVISGHENDNMWEHEALDWATSLVDAKTGGETAPTRRW